MRAESKLKLVLKMNTESCKGKMVTILIYLEPVLKNGQEFTKFPKYNIGKRKRGRL